MSFRFPKMPRFFLSALLIIYIGMFAPSFAVAQTDSLLYFQNDSLTEAGKGELRLHIENLNFFRNDEYASSFSNGYTLPGFFLAPTVSYQPLKNLRVEAGAHLLKYWGTNRYPSAYYLTLPDASSSKIGHGFHCVPIFRGELQLLPSLRVTIGTLRGKSQHGLVEPLYDEELNLTADPEAGLQIGFKESYLEAETWVNWENFIFKNDAHQEALTYGLSARFKPTRRKARVQWSLPLQVVFRHRGGELDTQNPDRSVRTAFNAAAGAAVRIPFAAKKPAALEVEATGLLFSQKDGDIYPFDEGYGFYSRVTGCYDGLRLTAGYWICHHFASLFGNPMYNSFSVDDPSLTYSSPRFFILRGDYAAPLGKGFAWGVHAELRQLLRNRFHQPYEGEMSDKSTFNYSFGFYLRISPSFLLKRFRGVL